MPTFRPDLIYVKSLGAASNFWPIVRQRGKRRRTAEDGPHSPAAIADRGNGDDDEDSDVDGDSDNDAEVENPAADDDLLEQEGFEGFVAAAEQLLLEVHLQENPHFCADSFCSGGGDDDADMDGVDGGQNHDLTDPDLIAEHMFGPDGVPEAHDEALQPPAPELEPHIPDHLPQVPAPPLPAAGAEPKQQRAPAVRGGQRTTPDIYADLPGGRVTFYPLKGSYEARCGTLSHGKCVLTRSCVASAVPHRAPQGRPLGLLVAWLAAGPAADSKAAHWIHEQTHPSRAQRQEGRDQLRQHPMGVQLFGTERPPRAESDEEPLDCA